MFNKILVLSLNSYLRHTVWMELLDDSGTSTQHDRYTAVDSGLNICRALAAYGASTVPILLIGEENSAHYSNLMLNYGIQNYRQVLMTGSVPIVTDNIDSDNNIFSERQAATALYAGTAQQIVAAVKGELSENTLIIISGTLPEQMTANELFYIVSELSAVGASFALDTAELSLGQLLELKPWCIKLNSHELEALSYRRLLQTTDIIDLCRDMCTDGIGQCIVSTGADGLYYCSNEDAFIVQVPKVDVLDKVGAGDMTTAGFIYSIIKDGHKLKRSLCTAAAFGTAACLTEGTNPPQKLSFASILGRVKIQQYMCGVVGK